MERSCRRRVRFKDGNLELKVFAAIFLTVEPLAAFNPSSPGVHRAPVSPPSAVDASAKGALDIQNQVSSDAMLAASTTHSNSHVPTFHRAIAALAQDGAVEEAREWFNMASQFNLVDLYAYNLMILACANAGEYADAEKWHSRISNAGFTPDITSYNNVLAACAVTGEFREAERWFENMISAGIKPDITSYKIIINTCAAAGEYYYSEAENWLRRASRAGLELDVSIFNAVIRACSFSSSWKQAVGWFVAMREAGISPDEDSIRALIEAYAKAGNYGEASSTMLMARREPGIQADELDLCNLILDIAAERGDHMQAATMMSDMLTERIVPDTTSYNAVIRACTKGHAYDEAKEWFNILDKGA